MSAVTTPPPVPVGEIKRFGPFGPKYEVGRAHQRDKILPPLDWLCCAKITLNLDKGEESCTP